MYGTHSRPVNAVTSVAGKANNALVVPAGLACANSIAKRPDLNLV